MILGTICARGGSKGVPRKALREIGGIPLIGHAIQCAKAASCLDRIVVSTDDSDIASVAAKYGAETPFLRPAELAQDRSPKWMVFRHLVTEYEALSGNRVTLIADLDVSTPLRRPGTVDKAVEKLLQSNADVVITAYPSPSNPYYNMVEQDPDGFAHIVVSPTSAIHERQSAPSCFNLTPAVFAIRRDTLWTYSHWSKSRMMIIETNRFETWDIDEKLDFEIVKFLYSLTNHNPD